MSLRLLSLILLALGLSVPPAANATGGIILNTLQGTDDHTPGWSGGIDGLFSGSGGNTDRIIVASNARVQWRGERNRWRLLIGQQYEENNGTMTARNFTAHLRHNFDLTPALATVAFVQAQENPFQRIDSRWLLGAGLRADIVDGDRGTLRVGATPMLEWDRFVGEAERTARGRLSTFVSASRRFGQQAHVDATGFVQPLFADFHDIRTTGTVAFVVDLTDALDLKVGASVETNSRPEPGVQETDWSTFTSLSVTL